MMNRFSSRRGFTLVEMLIVIAIIAVLVAIIIPTVSGTVERARWAACQADMRILRGEYTTRILLADLTTQENRKTVMEGLASSHHGTFHGDGSVGMQGGIAGVCPSGGDYRCYFYEEAGALNLVCTKHGTLRWEAAELTEILNTLSFDGMGIEYNNINEYFGMGDRQINSEAINTGSAASYGQYGSLAKTIEARLAQLGVDIRGRTWNLNNTSSGDKSLTMFLAPFKVDKSTGKKVITKYIQCDRYDAKTGECVSGYIKVRLDSGGYYALDEKTFTSEKPDDKYIFE